MAGIGCKLPLSISENDGAFLLNKTIEDTVKQNLKMLLLTIPGERCMDVDFGVGIERYLFENDTPRLREQLSTRIHDQVKKYMPFISIRDVYHGGSESVSSIAPNSLHVQIEYHIEPIGQNDILNITLPAVDKF